MKNEEMKYFRRIKLAPRRAAVRTIFTREYFEKYGVKITVWTILAFIPCWLSTLAYILTGIGIFLVPTFIGVALVVSYVVYMLAVLTLN